jgi:DNA polymerase-1
MKKRDYPHHHTEAYENTPHEYTLTDTPEKVSALLAALSANGSFCFDTKPRTGYCHFRTGGLSFSIEPGRGGSSCSDKREEALRLLMHFKSLFEDPPGKTGQNIKFDIQMLANYGIEVQGNFSIPCWPLPA